MKIYTEQEINDRITELINEVKSNWSKYGDLSDSTREELLSNLRWFRKQNKSVKRINLSKYKKLNKKGVKN